jgi:aspartyl-tRNA(Asn)/glutamyl-tRNA(Gln) amidotransferase subunit C
MESLSREQVLHVADLGKIAISEEEIEKFGYGLKQIWDEIDKINEVDVNTNDILITPVEEHNIYRDDEVSSIIPIDEAIKNAPSKKGNYIEIVRVIND